MITDLSIEYKVEKDSITGHQIMIPDRDEHQFLCHFKDLLINHISSCENFEAIYACQDTRTFQKVIACNCGDAWRIDELLFKKLGAEFIQFYRAIEDGLLRKSNELLMDAIAKKNVESAEQLEFSWNS